MLHVRVAVEFLATVALGALLILCASAAHAGASVTSQAVVNVFATAVLTMCAVFVIVVVLARSREG